MVLRLDADGVHAAAVHVLPVGQIGDVLVDQRALPVVYGKTEGVLMHSHPQVLSLDDRFLRPVCQFGSGRFHPAALPAEKSVRAGRPGCHDQAVGRFVPVPVKPGADAQDVVRQKPYADFKTIRRDGKIIVPPGDGACPIAYLHAVSLLMESQLDDSVCSAKSARASSNQPATSGPFPRP